MAETVDSLLDGVDYSFPGYTPTVESVKYIHYIKLVNIYYYAIKIIFCLHPVGFHTLTTIYHCGVSAASVYREGWLHALQQACVSH